MPRLTNSQRHEAVGILRGMSVNEVAHHFNCHRATIQKLKSRVQMTGTVRDLPRSGRPRVTSAADDRRIVITHLRDRFKTVASTAREWNNDNKCADCLAATEEYRTFVPETCKEKPAHR